jgi:hypothetical protein
LTFSPCLFLFFLFFLNGRLHGTVAKVFPPANGAIVALQFVRELLYIGCEKKVVILNPKTKQAQDATSPCGNALVLCLLHDGDRLL